MTCKTLINIIGKYNHYNILAALNLKPETIVLIRTGEQQESCENTRRCIAQKLVNTTIVEHIVSEKNFGELAKVIRSHNRSDVFLNLSGGSKLMSLAALEIAHGMELIPIYIDNDQGKILKLKNGLADYEPLKIELTVEDIVCSTGAEIIKHSTHIYDKHEFQDLIEYILENYESWKLLKGILRNTRVVRQYEFEPLLIDIDSRDLPFVQVRSMERLLAQLHKSKIIDNYSFYRNYISFTFSNRESKAFVMTAGCWLEALTYRCVKELKEVTNAISGMLFVWDENVRVHNELDVVASVDSHLICISCKDTDKYDVDDLNELEVYAEHLGGRKVKKILVSTQSPERGEMIYQRAMEMGIHIVLFRGDVPQFKEKLHKLFV